MNPVDHQTRRALLQAGLSQFARLGYAGASVQDISEQSGFSKPTLYYYFGSKAGIYAALLDHACDECWQRMQAAAGQGGDIEGQLVEVAFSLFEFVREERDLTRLVFASAFASRDEVPKEARNEQRRRRNLEFFQGLIEKGLECGELNPEFQSSDLALGIYGALVFHIMMSLLLPEVDLSREAARRIVRLFLTGAGRHGAGMKGSGGDGRASGVSPV